MILIPYVFLGGGLGATFRYLLTFPVQPLGLRPWMATLVANILGCILFFFFYRYFFHSSSKTLSTFFLTGMMGGLTTFSTFSFELVTSLKSGNISEAFLILGLNLFVAIILGFFILRGNL